MRIVKPLVKIGLTIGGVLLCVSCRPVKVNPPVTADKRGHAKCTDNGALVEIEIKATSDVLANPNDEVVVVCHKDKLRWFTKDDQISSFTVNFDKHNPLGLFGAVTFQSEKGASGDPHYPHQHSKDQEVIVPSGGDHHVKDYMYSIDVCCDPQKPGQHLVIDPHVIPMGK